MSVFGILSWLASATLAGYSNIVGPNVERKVSQAGAVANGLLGALHGELEALIIRVGVVAYDALAHLVRVEKTVNQVTSEVESCGVRGDVVAVAAHSRQRHLDRVGKLADHGLIGTVLAAPVASPA